mgnify:CR=1 FL=1
MGLNSTATAYNFGQLGSVHIHHTIGSSVTPPDGMVIVAITMIGATTFDILTADTSNSVVYGGTESNNAYFGITNGNTNGNGEIVDSSISFPAGMTIYGRWSVLSLAAQDTTGGIIAYFGF